VDLSPLLRIELAEDTSAPFINIRRKTAHVYLSAQEAQQVGVPLFVVIAHRMQYITENVNLL
jgi:hypothetical protein